MSATPLVAWIEGIGLRGPGLDDWPSAAETLAGGRAYVAAPTVLVPPAALPAAERRRVGRGVKIALDVGFAAAAHAGRDAATLPSVFTSSSGDGDNCDAICRELAADRLISPTRFHNSVHNAPSGYWGIASHAMAPSTSLCAYDHSFIAGLDEALAQLHGGADAVLLVAYDAPYPEPLHATRPTPDCFGVGLVLTRAAGPAALARIELAPARADVAPATLDDDALEACRTAIPAARSLPLLAAVAAPDERVVVLEGTNDTRWTLRVRPLAADVPLPTRHSACA
jgi:hypothetical protein